MKGLKVGILFFLAFFCVFSPRIVSADTFDDDSTLYLSNTLDDQRYNEYGYGIKNYDIELVVNENNTINVKEIISAYFVTGANKHGIYRKIPLYDIYEEEGSILKSLPSATVSNISVSYHDSGSEVPVNYSNYKENGYECIRIGSESEIVTGVYKYEINYLYNLGKDVYDDKDQFYYYLLGYGWDTIVEELTFKITLPKPVDPEKIIVVGGSPYNPSTDIATYSVAGNDITGSSTGSFYKYNGATIKITLPNGYFVGAGFTSFGDVMTMFLPFVPMIISFILLVFSFIMFLLFGVDRKVVETITFYPPDNLNSLEIGFHCKGFVNRNDVSSLFLYFLSKKYIKLKFPKEEGEITLKTPFVIEKLKEYDGDNEAEEIFFKSIFKHPNIYAQSKDNTTPSSNTENTNVDKDAVNSGIGLPYAVKSESLEGSFGTTIRTLLSATNSKKNWEKIYSKKLLSKILVLFAMVLIVYITAILPFSLVSCYGTVLLALYVVFFLFLFASLFFSAFCSKRKVLFNIGVGSHLAMSVISLALIIGFEISIISYLNWLIGTVTVYFIVVFINHMPKRNEYSMELLGRIKGFERFIKTAEADRVSQLCAEDADYFDNILSYAYVFGISNIWIKKFEHIAFKNAVIDFEDKRIDSHYVINNVQWIKRFSRVSWTSSHVGWTSSSSGGGGGGRGGGGGSW